MMFVKWIQVLYLDQHASTISSVLLSLLFPVSVYFSRIFHINVGMLSKFSGLILIGSMAFLALAMNFKSWKIYGLLRYLKISFKSSAANRREERKLAAVVLVMLLANLVACVLDFDMSSYTTPTNLMTLFCTAQFTSMLNILRTRLKHINRETYFTRDIFRYLTDQTYLCELIQEVNALFSLQLLAILLTEFLHIVCCMCYLIQHLYVIHFYNLILHSFTILYIVIKACYTTQYQISYSGRMIINFIASRKKPELNQNLDYVLECLSYNMKPFSLYQLISLDLQVLISIFAAVVTISIILIQIQLSNSSAASMMSLNTSAWINNTLWINGSGSNMSEPGVETLYLHVHNL